MVNYGLCPTSSKTLTKMEVPFGRAGCINTQPLPVRLWTMKSDDYAFYTF